ncbi:hypothetical protein BJV78DRAFT_1279327 [Lactifluus subvellereus]|nr:hypothetical protein BJV78DRAFT_1279327 [Lactifluus subvellereus]
MSYRTDSAAGYDQSLLSSVPGPTRAEKQEGYNVDLLEEARNRRPLSPPNGVGPDQSGAGLDYSPGAVSYARKEEPPDRHYETGIRKVPWYRRRWGIVVIVVVALLIIGGAVGGGVGGTRHGSHPHSTNNNGTGSTGSSNNGTTSVGQNKSQGNDTSQGTGPTRIILVDPV